MKRQVEPYIGAAIDSLQVALDRTGVDKTAFISDATLIDATLMRFQVAGEQLVKIRDLFPDFYDEHGSPAWHKLIGLRNIIAHGYSQINVALVWEVVSKHAPSLLKELKRLADERGVKY